MAIPNGTFFTFPDIKFIFFLLNCQRTQALRVLPEPRASMDRSKAPGKKNHITTALCFMGWKGLP
jgi:hypothetical protein